MDGTAPRAVVAATHHGARTVHRLVTAVTGRGFAIEELRYRVEAGSGRGLAVLVLDPHVASRDTYHLARVLEGAVDVLWASPLETPSATSTGGFVIEDLAVSTRRANGGTVSQAWVAARVDGARIMGAGEGARPLTALTEASTSAIRRVGGMAIPALETAHRWSTISIRGGSVVVAQSVGGGPLTRVLGLGDTEIDAAAAALSELGTAVLEQARRRSHAHARGVAS